MLALADSYTQQETRFGLQALTLFRTILQGFAIGPLVSCCFMEYCFLGLSDFSSTNTVYGVMSVSQRSILQKLMDFVNFS